MNQDPNPDSERPLTLSTDPFIAVINSTEEKETYLDSERLLPLLAESITALKSSKDKDITLTVGVTGAGKSTCVNYLLGSELEEYERGDGKAVRVKEGSIEFTKIGQTQDSQTLVPQVLSNSEFLVLCDCPGFLENRGPEEAICASVNINLVIQLSK